MGRLMGRLMGTLLGTPMGILIGNEEVVRVLSNSVLENEQ